MEQDVDMREVVLLSVYPAGIAPAEYGKIVNLIGTLTVSLLSSGKLKPQKVSIGRGSGIGRKGSIAARVRAELETGPKTIEHLTSALSADIRPIRQALYVMKAMRRGDGAYVTPGEARTAPTIPTKSADRPPIKATILAELANGPTTLERIMTKSGSTSAEAVKQAFYSVGARALGQGRWALKEKQAPAKIARGRSRGVLQATRRALESGPKSDAELLRANGAKNLATAASAARKLGAKRNGHGLYELPARAVAV